MKYQLITPRIPDQNLSLVERVLTNRGIDIENIQHYLNTSDEDILEPTLIKNLEEGAKMLLRHIAQQDDIFVQVDSDTDGYTSSAVLINYLYSLFPAFVQSHIYYRIHTGKQHGIIPSTIPPNIALVIAPDSSSNNYDEHFELKEKGIDVLVIDHHEAEKYSNYACVVNNQMCDYPTKSLSGVGMVYKMCQYIDSIFGKENSKNYLDLVSVGMIADMMELRDFETKHLVGQGLIQIRNPFLNRLVEAQDFSISKGGGLCPFTVSFYIAPQINATIRVGSQEEKLLLFESMLDYRGYEQIPSTKRGCKGQYETRVEQACRNCNNIKSRQTKARDASLEKIESIIKDQNLLMNKILVVKIDEELKINKNITGLIANELMSKYQRPVLLLNKRLDEVDQVCWEGSARSYDRSAFTNFKDFIQNSGYAYLAEGHQSAFGCGIKDSEINNFINYANEKLKDFDFSPSYKVDAIFDASNFKPSEILQVANYNTIWGQGVEQPLVAFENVMISSGKIRLLKETTLKITIPNGVDFIRFRSNSSEFDELDPELGCVKINIVGKCERNIWNGNVSPQVTIVDYEIVDKKKYYF